jgi:ferric-dicitrate binding protein FerR (iron transport regulator)
MMNCEQVVERLDEFLHDLLATDARSTVEAHLRTCASCGAALEKARKTWAALGEWQPRPPTSRAAKSTRRALPQMAPPPWAPAFAIAGAILLMLALTIVYHHRRPAVPSETVEPPTAKVDALPPAQPEKPVEAPAPERPKLESPTPLPEVEPPAVPPAPPAPRPVDPPAKTEEKKKAEPPAPAVGNTVAAAVARVERVKGDVRAGSRRATEGLELAAGEHLTTWDRDSQAAVRLPDSTQMILAGSTEIGYATGEVFLARGTVDVEARGNARLFSTVNAMVEGTAARFTLEKKDDVTTLQVRQGTVQFTNLVTGKLLQAKPGQNVKAEGHPKVDQRKVDAAVANGIAFLRGRPLAGLRGGTDELELVLYTLLHGGVPDRDPEVQALLKTMLALEPQKTYNTALRAMVLEKIDRVRYQEEIWKCAQYLLDNQSATGQWGYGTPTMYGPMPKRVPTGTATGGRPKAVDFSDKTVRHRVPVTKKRDGAASDNSNSQYAALGLRACHDAGIDLPKDAITLARKWLLDCQAKEEGGAGNAVATGGVAAPPRGWSYTTGPVYGSMTAGAIGSVCIYDYILEGEKSLSWKRDPAVLSGIAWLANNFSPTGNPGVDKAVGNAYSLIPDGAMYYYYLYAVERTGLLFGTEKFGAREWYPEGAAVLLKTQQADGSWPAADTHKNAVWDTCFSILFLRRATRPLQDVASEDSKSKK